MNARIHEGRLWHESSIKSPYSVETIDALETMIADADQIVADSNLTGELYFAGETATKVDDRSVNNKDVLLIVLLEGTIFHCPAEFSQPFSAPLYPFLNQ